MQISERDRTYWGDLGRNYAALGPPLRPTAEDLDCMESVVDAWSAAYRRSPRALMLGVTPQIAQMRFPRGSTILAADSSQPMLRAVWPGNVPGCRAAACANWRALPLRDASRDVVLGDGSFSCVRYPDGFRAVASEVRRVLCDEGVLILRAYIQAEPAECKEHLVEELLRGAMPSFHWFKFRLLMAMQESTGRGTPVDEVYRYWVSRNIDEAALIEQTGWDAPGIRLIEIYRGTDTVHTFSTLAEIQSVLGEFFEKVEVSTPSRFMGDRCPVLTAWARADAPPVRRFSGVAECAI